MDNYRYTVSPTDDVTVVSMQTFREAISRNRCSLASRVKQPMDSLAEALAPLLHTGNFSGITKVLVERQVTLPETTYMYLVTPDLTQISATVLPSGALRNQDAGRVCANAKHLQGALPYRGFILTETFTDGPDDLPHIAALQAVHREGVLEGILVAVFRAESFKTLVDRGEKAGWRQFKGDPSIRGTLFMQKRSLSLMDQAWPEAKVVMEKLMVERGVFLARLHFSSSRVTLWLVDQPYNYKTISVKELLDLPFGKNDTEFPPRAYPSIAKTDPYLLSVAFDQMKLLRDADENIYLRHASVNIMNNVVELTFSCDGSHYMSLNEFVEKSASFWLETSSPSCPS